MAPGASYWRPAGFRARRPLRLTVSREEPRPNRHPNRHLERALSQELATTPPRRRQAVGDEHFTITLSRTGSSARRSESSLRLGLSKNAIARALDADWTVRNGSRSRMSRAVRNAERRVKWVRFEIPR